MPCSPRVAACAAQLAGASGLLWGGTALAKPVRPRDTRYGHDTRDGPSPGPDPGNLEDSDRGPGLGPGRFARKLGVGLGFLRYERLGRRDLSHTGSWDDFDSWLDSDGDGDGDGDGEGDGEGDGSRDRGSGADGSQL